MRLRVTGGSGFLGIGADLRPVVGNEWIEVQATSRRVIIDDFRSAEVDGKTAWKGRQDKGHRSCAAAFRAAVTGEAGIPTEAMLATMRATIGAAAGPGDHA